MAIPPYCPNFSASSRLGALLGDKKPIILKAVGVRPQARSSSASQLAWTCLSTIQIVTSKIEQGWGERAKR